MSQENEKTKCMGPIWWGDQGIEECEACGDCICCLDGIDHSEAERECFKGKDGRCVLKMHDGRPCTTPQSSQTT